MCSQCLLNNDWPCSNTIHADKEMCISKSLALSAYCTKSVICNLFSFSFPVIQKPKHFHMSDFKLTGASAISQTLSHASPSPLVVSTAFEIYYYQDLYQQADSGHAKARSHCSFHFPLLCSTAALSVKTIICSRWHGDAIITAIPKILHYCYMPNNCPWFFQCVSLHASDISPPS